MNIQVPRFRVLTLAAVGAATCALSFPLRADPPTYRIFNLGVLSSNNASEALGLNDQGAIVGRSYGSTGGNKSFFWLFENMYGYTNPFVIQQLAGATSTANDINTAGVAVGKKTVSGDDIAHRWSLASGSVSESSLGTLAGGDESEAFAINDATDAVIVGESFIDTTGLPCGRRIAGFRYILDSSPSMELLGSLGQQYGAGALGVNNSSTAVAAGYRQEENECTVVSFGCQEADAGHSWSGTSALAFLDDLPEPFDDALHQARDVNDDGNFAGIGTIDGDPDEHNIDCVRRATYWASTSADPDVLDADTSTDQAHANAITNIDACDMIRVVGQNSTDLTALYWENDGSSWTTALLRDQLLNTCEWDALIEATDINENGWIVGYADHQAGSGTQIRAFLLLPTVEACYADLNGDCKVNGLDLAILLADWEEEYCADRTCLGDLRCDGEHDGVVNGFDNAIVLAAWTGSNLCSEACVEGWGICDGGGESAQSSSSSEDEGTNPTLIAELIEQLISLGEIEQAAQLAELTGS